MRFTGEVIAKRSATTRLVRSAAELPEDQARGGRKGCSGMWSVVSSETRGITAWGDAGMTGSTVENNKEKT